MKTFAFAVRASSLQTFVLAVVSGLAGCATQEPLPSDEGGAGGSVTSGGGGHGGSSGATGGRQAGGATSAGGSVATGGGSGTGGAQATGGRGAGGAATGGTSGAANVGGAGLSSTGGSTTAGTGGTGGRGGTGSGVAGRANGGAAGGGSAGRGTAGTGTAGSGTAGTGAAGASSTTPLDCSAIPALPTGGTVHSGNTQGGKDNLAWQIWSNGGSGSLTTFSTAAFVATWNNSGDYLGRMGFEWGNSGKAFSAYGDITADLAFKKNGSAGQYSYVGIYGWSTNPCIEWYIVDDSFSAMPFNTGTAPSGTADLDGGTYNLVKRNTTGTGGNRCGNVTAWDQFYSIRHTGRQCGTISVSEHFKLWDAKGWKLGTLLEVKILVEAASGAGSVEFSVANVKKTL
jgi:endo-1,4-beta-xylanase